MRIGLNFRNKYAIEIDLRISKSNYGSRPNYSIKAAILPKQLIYDNNKLTNQVIAHNMIDLEAYCDRQLTPMRSIMQESMGVE